MIKKQDYPRCYSVAYCDSTYFRYHAFKVKEDRKFILQLIEDRREDALAFMESFYKLIHTKDRICEKDIYARNNFRLEAMRGDSYE